MPLLVDDSNMVDVSSSTRHIYQTHPHLRLSANVLCAQPSKLVGNAAVLYVGQREFAVTSNHDERLSVLGSDDATTCHIVVIRNSLSGAVGLAHFDGYDLEFGVGNILAKIHSISCSFPPARLEVHIVGGFLDDRGSSEDLSLSLLRCLNKQPGELRLVTLCVGEANTVIRGGIHWPIVYGIGVHIKTGDIFPATFSDKGPEMPLRSARNLTGSQKMLDIYDCLSGILRIGPFSYQPLRGVEFWLAQSDQFILENLSTSPQVEPPHFVSEMRATLRQIQQHPFPEVTIFPGNQAHCYRKEESGQWVPVP